MKTAIPLFILFCIIFPSLCIAQVFAPNFGVNGRVDTDLFGGKDVVRRVKVLNNSKILAAGNTFNASTGKYELGLVRYNPDGAIDSTFGIYGKVSTAISNTHSYLRDMLVFADNKFLCGVYGTTAPYEWTVIKYMADGKIDSTYGNNGIATVLSNTGASSITCMCAVPNGQVLVGGYKLYNNVYLPTITRLNCDGSIDSSFANNGFTQPAINTKSFFNTIKLLPDGKIQAGGHISYTNLNRDDLMLVRYLSDGMLDSTFGQSGLSLYNAGPTSYDTINDLEIMPDGRIVAAGTTGYDYDSQFLLARFKPDGAIDSTFGTNGIAKHELGDEADRIIDIIIEAGGKIVAMCESYTKIISVNYYTNTTITRYNSNGSLDPNSGHMLFALGIDHYGGNMDKDKEGRIIGCFSDVYANTDFDYSVVAVIGAQPTGLCTTPYNHYIQKNICAGESYTYNCLELTSNTLLTDTFKAYGGCDSIVTFSLHVGPIYNTINASICSNETYPFKGQQIALAGIYTDSLISAEGCDSIITLQLNVLPAITDSSWAIICAGDTFVYNGTPYYAAGTYYDTLPAQNSCDSILQFTLTVNELPMPVIEQKGDTLTTGNYTEYYWLKDGMLLGNTQPYYLPIASGSYNIIVVDSNGCTNTALPINIVLNGIASTIENELDIFPNPTNGMFTITAAVGITQLSVTDNLGRIVYTKQVSGTLNEQVDISAFSNGVYALKVSNSKGQIGIERIFKQ